MSTMRTILITGFGRFPGSPVNPSGMVAVRLARRRRPAFAGTRRVAHVFATRYDAVDRELPALLARERPDIVVLFGVAPRSRHVRIEERARNRRSVLFPDAGGYRPAALAIAPGIAARRNAVAPRPPHPSGACRGGSRGTIAQCRHLSVQLRVLARTRGCVHPRRSRSGDLRPCAADRF